MGVSACSKTRRCWINTSGSMERTGAKVTAFLVTSLLDRYGDRYRRLGERIPVEFEIHSHAHDLRDPCSRADIEAAMSAFRGFAGRDPIGYRAPVGRLTREGLDALLDLGFRYDSSIYPSLRPGKWGHNNLHLSVAPFRITRGGKSIIEVPFATLSGVRLDFSLSYVKVLGWRAYELLHESIPAAGSRRRPDASIRSLRPSAAVRARRLRGARCSGETRAPRFALLEKMLRFLRAKGYEFALLSDLCDHLAPAPLPELSIERVVRGDSCLAAHSRVDPRLTRLRRIAVVPAYNEEGGVARVIDEIRDFDPGFEVVVVDDGSGDRTTEVAEEKGARVLTLPYNLGIGGSVQTAFRYALENDFELAMRLDGDGQHDAAHLPALIAPVLDGEADVAVGSRYLGDGGYRQSAHRNLGNRILAGAASARHAAAASPTRRRAFRR